MTDTRPISLRTTVRIPLGKDRAHRERVRSAAYAAARRYVATCPSERALGANVPLVVYGGSVVDVDCAWSAQNGGRDYAAERAVRDAITALDTPCVLPA